MDGKTAGFKLAGGTAAHLPPPVAGESLNRPDESKLSSVRFLLFPLVVLRTPCADLRSACHGGIVGCRNLAWLSAVVGKNSQVSCKVHNDKSLLPNGRRCRANSETDERDVAVFVC